MPLVMTFDNTIVLLGVAVTAITFMVILRPLP